MKSPLKKLGALASGLRKKHHSLPKLDEISQASQDMQDMKDCYDSLLSSAAATTNSAYEFSESLREMGDCLLEKTSLNDEEESGRVLLMLGKVQFQIQKLLDNYRSHISRTITVPSESLLNELRIVEDMKKQCDEKRILYDEMKLRHKERRRLGSKKGEYVSTNQVRVAREEFEEDATLFVFRMKSLKVGQSRSLLTQAARHHAAQVCFFKKALKSLETIDPFVQSVTQQNHIDYQFSGLEDDDRDSVFLTTDDEDDETDEDGELSFNYHMNGPKSRVSSSENSMELDCAELTFPQVAPLNPVKRKPLWNSSTFNINVNAGSKSAPLSADPGENFRQMRHSSSRKLNTYVLPTPKSETQPALKTSKNMWHSSPLERSKKYETEKVSKPTSSKPTPLPSPVKPTFEPRSSFSSEKVKRYAFSGPIRQFSGSVLGSSPPNSTKIYSFSGGFVSTPKISELHELPRPPPSLSSPKPPSKVGFSAPLVTNKPTPSNAASTLPMPSESRNLKATVSSPKSPVSIRNSSLNYR